MVQVRLRLGLDAVDENEMNFRLRLGIDRDSKMN